MRILKYKIAQRELKRQSLEEQNVQAPAPPGSTELTRKRLRTRVLQPSLPQTVTPKGSTSRNNIMKNYSRAFIAFAQSPIAVPYLKPLLQRHLLEMEPFQEFVKSRQKFANCIKGLRDTLLLVTVSDSHEIGTIKVVFQQLCVVFLKFFCVNWIFSGKVVDKLAHLSYRLKLLRRVKNPADFICLENFHSRN